MKINIVHQNIIRNIKSRFFLLFSIFMFLLSLFVFFSVYKPEGSIPMECSGYLNIIDNDYSFSGSLALNLHKKTGSALMIGKLYFKNNLIANINRNANLSLIRDRHTTIIKSNDLVTYESPEVSEKIASSALPLFMTTTKNSSTYEIVRQNDNRYLILRGTIVLLYCGNSLTTSL